MAKNETILLEEAVKNGELPELEFFPSPFSAENSNSVVKIVFPEFTCLCPKTGYPDFASIEIYYLPDQKCVELKSWKLYLNSFRNLGTFHERVINFLFDELNKQLEPKWLRVVGDFFPRGNVNTTVVVESPNGRPQCAESVFENSKSHARGF
ncbi:MAG: preQ(1) synthase [Chitinivibrionia bacterium]|nr:preQ(1) synthase [Chitinivibrionia bacterium]